MKDLLTIAIFLIITFCSVMVVLPHIATLEGIIDLVVLYVSCWWLKSIIQDLIRYFIK
jgi:hypothetical protein